MHRVFNRTSTLGVIIVKECETCLLLSPPPPPPNKSSKDELEIKAVTLGYVPTEGQPYSGSPKRTYQQSKNIITNLLVVADISLLAKNLQEHLTSAQKAECHKCVALADITLHPSTQEIGQLIKRNKQTNTHTHTYTHTFLPSFSLTRYLFDGFGIPLAQLCRTRVD